MKVLVCGSRHYANKAHVWSYLDSIDVFIEEIIEGEAPGVDTLARLYGEARGIPVKKFPAFWDTYGKSAGPIRNRQMIIEGKPDLVVAFMAKKSRGTKDMCKQATLAGIEVRVIEI
jgi:hypothetical protein